MGKAAQSFTEGELLFLLELSREILGNYPEIAYEIADSCDIDNDAMLLIENKIIIFLEGKA